MSHLANPLPQSFDHKIADTLLWLEDMRTASKWDLSQEEACLLMGGVTRNTYKTWIAKAKSGQPVKLGEDHITRLSLLAGIHKALALSSPQGSEFDFFKRPITHILFAGNSAKTYLLQNSNILNLFAVRNHFDARRA